ncbi:MAG TPA: C45 family peptidase [Chloroflexota bacterium]|nr:C45 family peptidase [Chloroflexota bacterium]
MRTRTYPHVRVSGSPFERGRGHGDQAGDLIRRFADWLIDGLRARQGVTRQAVLERTLGFLPMYEQFAPHLVEEIRGVAAGARVMFAEALLCNVRGEVGAYLDEGCTAFALGRRVTAGGDVLAGQNSDQDLAARDVSIVLSIEPDRGPAITMFTHAGEVGYHGFNSAGVAVFANSLPRTTWQPGMPHYLMKRVLLEQTSVEACLAVLRRARVASPGNYVLADRSGRTLDVELTPRRAAIVEPRDDYVMHANHYEHPDLEQFNAGEPRLERSIRRSARLGAIVADAYGRVTVDTLKTALSDHADGPAAICGHDPDYLTTVASLIAEPDHGRFHVSHGNPCRGGYAVYVMP